MFTVVYLLLLVVVVLFSWIAGVYGLMSADGDVVSSLLSAEALRWWVRHSMEVVAAAPVVPVLLVMMMVSAVRGCGLSRYVARWVGERRLPSLTRRERHAAYVAWAVFAVAVAVVASGLVGPGGNLLSVTGHVAGGPFAQGWLFLSWMVVCVPCVVYGRLSGLWRGGRDVLGSLTTEVARCASYFVTLVVASQLMAALRYAGVFVLLGMGDGAVGLFAAVLYGVPLVAAFLRGEEAA